MECSSQSTVAHYQVWYTSKSSLQPKHYATEHIHQKIEQKLVKLMNNDEWPCAKKHFFLKSCTVLCSRLESALADLWPWLWTSLK